MKPERVTFEIRLTLVSISISSFPLSFPSFHIYRVPIICQTLLDTNRDKLKKKKKKCHSFLKIQRIIQWVDTISNFLFEPSHFLWLASFFSSITWIVKCLPCMSKEDFRYGRPWELDDPGVKKRHVLKIIKVS